MTSSVVDTLRRLRRAGRRILGLDLFVAPELACGYESFGRSSGVWCVRRGSMTADSIVYSFGIGEDLSFELDLAAVHGTTIHAFDPTPRSHLWIANQTFPPQITVHNIGLADFDGDAVFFPPDRDQNVSFSIHRPRRDLPAVKCPVRRLVTLCGGLGHRKIDVLKMDIEGSEYACISDLLSSGIQVRQLLVEFHHRWNRKDIARTREAIRGLRDSGFKLFYVSPTGMEYSFWNVNVG